MCILGIYVDADINMPARVNGAVTKCFGVLRQPCSTPGNGYPGKPGTHCRAITQVVKLYQLSDCILNIKLTYFVSDDDADGVR